MTSSFFSLKRLVHLLITLTCLDCLSCSHSVKKSENEAAVSPQQSKIEISYELRHSRRRFIAEQKDEQVTGQTYLDYQVVQKGPIDPMRYREFLLKTSELIQKGQNTLSEDPSISCRAPLTITLTQDQESHSLKGCRTEGEGILSRLVKEAELLLNSRK